MYTASQKRAKLGDQCLQEAWTKVAQFWCKALEKVQNFVYRFMSMFNFMLLMLFCLIKTRLATTETTT